jgi:hypothetical protein
MGVLIKSRTGDDEEEATVANQFKAQLWYGTGGGSKVQDFTFNFTDDGNPNYIRDVFNTSPVVTNSTVVNSSNVTEGKQRYWLGETFERHLADNTATGVGEQWGVILPLASGALGATQNANWTDRANSWVNAQTGWYFSQDNGLFTAFSAPNTTTKLFKFHALDYGSWANKNLKIAIEDITAGTTATSPWGTFSVAVYHASAYDTDEPLEKFANCTLNPNSADYVAYKVGDKYLSWSDANKVHTEKGEYVNRSKYVRIEMNPDIDHVLKKSHLPFGVTGPLRSVGFSYTAVSGSPALYFGYTSASMVLQPKTASPSVTSTTFTKAFVTGGLAVNPLGLVATNTNASTVLPEFYAARPPIEVGQCVSASVGGFTGSWIFPAPAKRSNSEDGPGSLGSDAYFGLSATKTSAVKKFDVGYGDYMVGLPFDSTIAGRFDTLTGAPMGTEYSWVFSLDNISGSANNYNDVSGSRAQTTAADQSITSLNSSYKAVLSHINQFWAPMYGGHDGLDIKEAEPFRNSNWSSSTTNLNDAAYNSVFRAIETVADDESVECSIMTAPGIINPALTNKLMTACQDRGDALAIIDIESVYTPTTESTESFSNRLGSVSEAVSAMQTRDLNNSYGCCYYPWVQIKDMSKGGKPLWVPPSVVALGTFASNDASSELWFAPAGFNRGGLGGRNGSGGLPVIGLTERLTSKKRDDLYLNNINPIAKFPAEGIVIFGQKTLQQTSSALDRINVRRLMIYVKKEISRIAATILFDNNVKTTWDRFSGEVEPFLASIQSRFGLTEFKVVLDDTTTTADLIDRNIMYAKIFLKPARSIEFIAVDFIITRTGAAFED